jgi:hypothetical protein
MRTFTQKSKATQQTTLAKSTIRGRAHFEHSRERMVQTNAEELEGGWTATAALRIGHDFSQIPIHASAIRATQTKPVFGKLGDEYEQDTNAQEEMGEMKFAPIFPPAAPSLQSDSTRIPIMPPPIQSKSTVSSPDDPFEREAEDVADKVMRMTGPLPLTCFLPANPHAGNGKLLPREVRSYFEPRFGQDFSDVRVHADGVAANAARAVEARAYTIGRDVVFASGEYRPGTLEGKRLLAHELAHVVQQRQGLSRGILMRQPALAKQVPPRASTVQEAAEFLEDMARFIERARSFASIVMGSTPRAPVTPAARKRAHDVLNQQRLRDMLANAQRVFAAQEPALQRGSTEGTRLRAALLGVIAKIREVAPVALAISEGMPAPVPDNERSTNAQLVVELIEADPFTSSGLTGMPAFGAAETAAGTSHEAFIEAYLDDLIRMLPGQTLAAAAREQILERISAGLRRAFLTIRASAAGTLDVRGITNPRIVGKYRRVIGLLSAAMPARPAQLSIITDSLPAYVLPPDPVPDVTPQLHASPNIGRSISAACRQASCPTFAMGCSKRQTRSFPSARLSGDRMLRGQSCSMCGVVATSSMCVTT